MPHCRLSLGGDIQWHAQHRSQFQRRALSARATYPCTVATRDPLAAENPQNPRGPGKGSLLQHWHCQWGSIDEIQQDGCEGVSVIDIGQVDTHNVDAPTR